MKMWLKQATLVLLLVEVAVMVGSGNEHVFLDEVQRTVEVEFGSSLTLCCRLQMDKSERSRVRWYFNPSGSSLNGSIIIFEKVMSENTSSGEKTGPDSYGGGRDSEKTHCLANVTHKNSGWYFCEVIKEIPIVENINSKGTHVVIMNSSMEAKTYPSLMTSYQATPPEEAWSITWWMWVLLGVSILILVALLVTCVMLRRRCRRSKAEDPIYSNTRPVASKQPSPRPGLPGNQLRMVPPSPNLWTPCPSRRHDDGKSRHKQ